MYIYILYVGLYICIQICAYIYIYTHYYYETSINGSTHGPSGLCFKDPETYKGPYKDYDKSLCFLAVEGSRDFGFRAEYHKKKASIATRQPPVSSTFP